MAETLGETEHGELLTQTLDEEKETNEKLTSLAEEINSAANTQEDEAETPKDAKSAVSGTKGKKRVA